MQTILSPSDMQKAVQTLRAHGKRIGFLPTMGYLHEGHRSLIRLVRREVDVVVVSIFVNPTQFGPGEDFNKYPRNFQRDEDICRHEATDIVFYPSVNDMYPSDSSVFVVEEKLSRGLCGVSRPGHFRGVCTVVAKLLNIVQPDVAVFGEKDAQQLRIIERMVRDLNFPIRILRGPTCREPDGLAMSSRNSYLSREERTQAVCLRRALDRAEELYREGERRADRIVAEMRMVIDRSPAASIDYIEVVDDSSLEGVKIIDRPCLAAVAVFVGKTRLIDNTVLGR